MKKPLLFFIISVVLIIVVKIAYNKYCESKPEGCKKEKYDEDQGLPKKGIDW